MVPKARALARFAAVPLISLAAAWTAAEPPTARVNPEFQVPASPDLAVLRVTTNPGMSNWVRVLEIFGDGRMVVAHYLLSTVPKHRLETRVPRAELVRLVTDLAEWNVLEGEWQQLPTVRASRFITDASSVVIEVRLTRYKQRMVKPDRSIPFRFGGYALLHAVSEHPEVLELVAVGRLLARIEELTRQHPPSPT